MEHAEEWRAIDGYRGDYEVSNFGRVRSWKQRECRILAFKKQNAGYKYVILSGNGIPKCFCIHRLVASAFIPNDSNKDQINHINLDKTDNRVENLEWVNESENMKHVSGLRKRKGLLPINTVLGIAIDVITLGMGTNEASRKWGVYSAQVRDIKSGRAYHKQTAHLRNG